MFTVVQVAGDNLGLHDILGYIESFSGNYVCRFFKADKIVVRSLTLEDPALLRDHYSYEADLRTADSDRPEKRQCLQQLVFLSCIRQCGS